MSNDQRHKDIIDRVFEFVAQRNDAAGNFRFPLADAYKHVQVSLPDATDEEIRQHIELWVADRIGISIIGEDLVGEEPSFDDMLKDPPTKH